MIYLWINNVYIYIYVHMCMHTWIIFTSTLAKYPLWRFMRRFWIWTLSLWPVGVSGVLVASLGPALGSLERPLDPFGAPWTVVESFLRCGPSVVRATCSDFASYRCAIRHHTVSDRRWLTDKCGATNPLWIAWRSTWGDRHGILQGLVGFKSSYAT